MNPPFHFIASYTGLQTIVTAQRGQVHPLAPKMHPSESWRERHGNIQLDYNGQDLTARLIMDDGQYSGIILENITPSQAKIALHQKTLLLQYVAEEVQFTGAEKQNNKNEYKTAPRKTTLYSLQIQGLLLEDQILTGKAYSSQTTTKKVKQKKHPPPLPESLNLQKQQHLNLI